jgi:hemerythrin
MTWNETYLTNVSEADAQHEELFRMMNDLHDSLSADRAVIGEKLNALVQFVLNHFATEEKFMQETNYPNYDQHKEAHDKLVETVGGLQAKFNSGEAELTEEVTAFVRDWLYNHIPGTDKPYGPYLNEKGIS